MIALLGESPPTPDPLSASSRRALPRGKRVGGGEKATCALPSPHSRGGPRRELALKGSGAGGYNP
jgi:hypothetical protein